MIPSEVRSIRAALNTLGRHIDAQTNELEVQAQKAGIAPYELLNADGTSPMVALLLARSNVLLALTNLEKGS